MDKDNGSSLGSLKELGIAVSFGLKELEKMVFKFFSIMRGNRMIFSGPTDDTGRYPAENLEGSKSCIREGK